LRLLVDLVGIAIERHNGGGFGFLFVIEIDLDYKLVVVEPIVGDFHFED
jgi:hypothetical protein